MLVRAVRLRPDQLGAGLNTDFTILVVEDEALIRMVTSDQLQHCGLKVLEAANAKEAMDALAVNHGVRVVFTDVDMPGGIDGLELAAAIKDRWPPIKIIVTSGRGKVDLSDIPANARFFTKPYDASHIASVAREMMAA